MKLHLSQGRWCFLGVVMLTLVALHPSTSRAQAVEAGSQPQPVIHISLEEIKRDALKGDARSQANLAFFLKVDGNYSESAEWYRKAAEQGDAGAQFELAEALREGTGVKKDDKQAATWYSKAAEQGNVDAQFAIAGMFARGKGVTQDDRQAFLWYDKAAQQGLASAQLSLGHMFYKGKGVAKDESQAFAWYLKAAEQGLELAQWGVAICLEQGAGVTQDTREAVKWYRKAADQGNPHAQFRIGAMLAEGEYVTKDESEAVNWYRRAAEQGNADAQNGLGAMLITGSGVAKDVDQAAMWFKKAAQQGQGWAQRNLAYTLSHGEGVPVNVVAAYTWLNLSASSEDPHPDAVAERGRLALLMSSDQLSEAQRLSRDWKPGSDLGKIRVKNVLPKRINASSSNGKQSSSEIWPDRPEKRPGVTTCNTRCINGDCRRTYDNGRKVRFQARQKWNPFNSQFEWDSGSC